MGTLCNKYSKLFNSDLFINFEGEVEKPPPLVLKWSILQFTNKAEDPSVQLLEKYYKNRTVLIQKPCKEHPKEHSKNSLQEKPEQPTRNPLINLSNRLGNHSKEPHKELCPWEP